MSLSKNRWDNNNSLHSNPTRRSFFNSLESSAKQHIFSNKCTQMHEEILSIQLQIPNVHTHTHHIVKTTIRGTNISNIQTRKSKLFSSPKCQVVHLFLCHNKHSFETKRNQFYPDRPVFFPQSINCQREREKMIVYYVHSFFLSSIASSYVPWEQKLCRFSCLAGGAHTSGVSVCVDFSILIQWAVF